MPAGNGRDLKSQIETLTERVHFEQQVSHSLVEGQIAQRQQMTEKFPNLGGIATALDKLTSAIEDDAQEVMKKIEAVHEKRARVFTKAKERTALRDAALDGANAALDKLDGLLGDNGGPKLPT